MFVLDDVGIYYAVVSLFTGLLDTVIDNLEILAE